VARFLNKRNGRRGLVLVVGAIVAALNAKGVLVHPFSFWDGPH